MSTEHAEGSATGSSRVVRAALVALVAGLSLLPLGRWLDQSFQRALSLRAVDWWSGSLLIALLATVLFIVVRRDHLAQTLARPMRGALEQWERHPVRSVTVLAVFATALYAGTSWAVFDARPLLIDELVQVMQARAFASGRLWLPLDAYPEFRSMLHMVEQDGRWYAQFPPGGPAMLALGELVRAPWLVNPVCGGVSVAAFASALRWAHVRTSVSLGATLAFAFAPFVVFQSASHMNHVTSLTWLLVATAALVRATHGGRSASDERPLAAFVCGIALGAAATIRPLDAAAWALPAAAWLGWRAWRLRHWRALLVSGFGVALPMAAMLWVNAQTTGDPLTFGYTVLWGSAHGLGFHASPWGESHTIARGIALVAAYLNSLNVYLFDVPAPSLIPALAALLLVPRFTALERYLLASAGLVVIAYFAYWHDGFFLGPRFMVPLAPLAVLFVAKLPEAAAGFFRDSRARRGVLVAYASAIVLGLALELPLRVRAYAGGFQSMRWDYDALAAQAGASGGVVLVRESWGAQVIHRMWALGVSRSFTEQLYRQVDTCGLDDMTTQLEATDIRGAAAEARYRPMLADSARVVLSSLSPDGTQRVLPGSAYPQRCLTRIAEDRGGYTLFGAMLLARDTSTMWVRDLHARDSLVVALDGAREIWMFRRTPDPDVHMPVFVRLNRDSIRSAWGLAPQAGTQ